MFFFIENYAIRQELVKTFKWYLPNPIISTCWSSVIVSWYMIHIYKQSDLHDFSLHISTSSFFNCTNFTKRYTSIKIVCNISSMYLFHAFCRLVIQVCSICTQLQCKRISSYHDHDMMAHRLTQYSNLWTVCMHWCWLTTLWQIKSLSHLPTLINHSW